MLEGKKTRRQVLVPNSLQSKVFGQLQSAVTGGHMEVRRILANIQGHFYWVLLKEDVMK